MCGTINKEDFNRPREELVDRALMLIRHEAIQRSLVGDIIQRIEKKGLKIAALKMGTLNEEKIRKLYGHCIDTLFFDEMVKYHTEGPVIFLVVEGADGNINAKQVCGKIGNNGTVRGDFAMSESRNLLHCSDSDDTGKQMELLFNNDEVFIYELSSQKWIK